MHQIIHQLSKPLRSLAAVAALWLTAPGCGSRHPKTIDVPKEKVEQWDKEEQEANERMKKEAAAQGRPLE
ncbi:MAG TPA: hypothetical protein VJ783_10665 [Pirellulales bacterium]|nr:hypothetical protein [Pirellulales bacterium]